MRRTEVWRAEEGRSRQKLMMDMFGREACVTGKNVVLGVSVNVGFEKYNQGECVCGRKKGLGLVKNKDTGK